MMAFWRRKSIKEAEAELADEQVLREARARAAEAAEAERLRRSQQEARKDYEKALQEGEVPVTYGRVTFIGQAAVGKTSLKHGLMNKPLPKVAESTVVADVHNVKSYGWAKAGSSSDSLWENVTNEDEIREIAQLMKHAAKQQPSPSSHDMPHTEDEVPLAEAKSIFQQKCKVQSPMVAEKEMKKIRNEEVKEVFEEALVRVPNISSTEVKSEVWLHVWDFGGQPVFLDVLPAFLTSFTMFLLLFDASKDLEKKVKVVQYIKGKKSESDSAEMCTLDLLQQWMAAIFCHVTKLDCNRRLMEFPRIIPIGTHGDKANKKVTLKKWHSYCNEKIYSKILLPAVVVDNTKAGKGEKEDPAFTDIRRKIHTLTSEKLKVKTPVTWVLFRKVLKRLSKTLMTLNEVYDVAVACHILEEVVPSVLKFYHELGVLLYYSHIESLQKIVIVDPEWLVKELGKLLILDREVHVMTYLWSKLFKKGIVIESLYKEVWKDCGIKPDALMDLLVKFHLAVEVPSQPKHSLEKEFFLPSMLKYYHGNPSDLGLDFVIDRCASLFVTFAELSCVPPGFFIRLVTTLASFKQRSHLYEIDFRRRVYRNRITYSCQYPKSDILVLTELPSAIQIDLVRCDSHPKAFWTVCQELLSSVDVCCKEVADILHTSQKNVIIGKESQPALELNWEFALRCEKSRCRCQFPKYCYFTPGDDCILCDRGSCQTKPHQRYWCSEQSVGCENTFQSSSSQQSPFPTADDHDQKSFGEAPEVSDLMDWIIPQAAAQWKLIGDLLNISEEKVEAIERDHAAKINEALLDVFRAWRLNENPPYVWKTLLNVLASEDVGYKKLADSVAVKLRSFLKEPTMCDLMDWIGCKAATQWKMIGVKLNVSIDSLETIAYTHKEAPTEAILAVFIAWQKTTCSPFTWKTILDVLASNLVARKDIAYDIRRRLCNPV